MEMLALVTPGAGLGPGFDDKVVSLVEILPVVGWIGVERELLAAGAANASFFSLPSAPAPGVVLTVYANGNSTQLVLPPLMLGNNASCLSSSYSDVVPALAFFRVSYAGSSFSYSFSCSTSSCAACDLVGTTSAGVRVAQGGLFVEFFTVQSTSDTLTTLVYTDPLCSAFVWLSTPLVTTNGDCQASEFFDPNGESTYFSTMLIQGANATMFAVSAHCSDAQCSDCVLGGIGQLSSVGEADVPNYCVNLVPLVQNDFNGTFYVTANLGGLQPWPRGRIVTIAIGVAAAVALLACSICVVVRSRRSAYQRVD